MIDTDKYEGHTEGPWTLSEEYAYELFIYAGDVRLAKMDGNAPLHVNEHGNPEDVNAQLIADTPRILQAYKRLREQLTSADKMIRNMIRESRDTPREAYVSGSAREAEQLFVHVLEANWDEVIE